jgi:hypothetical protein
MPTTGLWRCNEPVEPKNAAFPKEKIPPSEATNQYPDVGIGGPGGVTLRVNVHVPVLLLVSISTPLTVYIPGASEEETLILPVLATTTEVESVEVASAQKTGPEAFVTLSCPLKLSPKGTVPEVGGPWMRVLVLVKVTVAEDVMAAALMVPLMVAVPAVAEEVRMAV